MFTARRGGPPRESKFVPDRFKPAIGAANDAIAQLGHATASITPRLEDARTEALANLTRTQRGPAVVPIRESAGQ